jgi:type II secretory pathway component PulC
MPTIDRPARRRIIAGAVRGGAACAVFGMAFYAAFDIPDVAKAVTPAVPGLPAPPASQSVTTAPAAAAPAAPIAAARTDRIILYGVSGGGARGRAAILGEASGPQRVVPIGRSYRTGLVVAAVGLDHVVLKSVAGEVRLSLAGRKGAAHPAPAAPTNASSNAASALASIDSAKIRAGLAPHRSGGRIDGFAVRPAAALPFLSQAGLQAGDVIVSVNGQTFDSQEKLLDLPREIAGSYTAEFEFIRNGKRMKAALPVNSKPNM